MLADLKAFFMKISQCLLLVAFTFPLLFSCQKDDSIDEASLPDLNTCRVVNDQGGILTDTYDEKLVFDYNSSDNDYNIKIAPAVITITHKERMFSVQLWGGNDSIAKALHENLNGKHIKDRKSSSRTFICSDNLKLTATTDPKTGKIVRISIYDGQRVQIINLSCSANMRLIYSEENSMFAQQLDYREIDGETSVFDITEEGMIWKLIYTENSVNKKTYETIILGQVAWEFPNQVNDLYDDPDLDHT